MVAAPAKALLWPLRNPDFARTTEATTYAVRVVIDSVAETLVCPTLTPFRNYWMSGDDEPNGDGGVGGVGDVGRRFLEQTLLGHPVIIGGETVEVSVSATNRINILCSMAVELLWSHADSTLSALPFGWTQVDTAALTSSTAPNQTYGAWCPGSPAAYDSRERGEFMGAAAQALSGAQRVAVWGEKRAEREIRFDLLLPRYARREYADATEPRGTLEDLWRYGLMRGLPLRVYDDASVRTSSSYGGPYLHDRDSNPWKLEQLVDRAGAGRRLGRFKGQVKLRRVAV